MQTVLNMNKWSKAYHYLLPVWVLCKVYVWPELGFVNGGADEVVLQFSAADQTADNVVAQDL